MADIKSEINIWGNTKRPNDPKEDIEYDHDIVNARLVVTEIIPQEFITSIGLKKKPIFS
jgi:hypothetical protein